METNAQRVLEAFERHVHTRMTSFDASHDIHHVYAVRRHLERICEQWTDETQVLVAQLVATGHELCDKKYIADPVIEIKLAQSVLAGNTTDEISACVMHLIPLISFSRRRSLGIPELSEWEKRVYMAVSDADLIESLGVVGMLRTFMYQNHAHGDMRSALQYVREHLLDAHVYVDNEWAQREACRRCRLMKELVSRYNEERCVPFD